MSDDGRKHAATKPAIRSAPAATLPGLAAAPAPPSPPAPARPGVPAPARPGVPVSAPHGAPAPARPLSPTLPGHDAATPALPARQAVAMPATAPPATSEAPIELDVLGPPTQANGERRRKLVLAAGGAAVAVLALVVGLRVLHHTPPAIGAPPAHPAAAPAPPVVAIAPLEAPAAPKEVVAEPSPTLAPPAENKPRVRHRPAPRKRAVARQERRRPAPKRTLAMKEKPSGDRDGARAAYQRGNDLLLTGNAAGAIDAYQEAVRLAPAEPVGYRGLGLAYEKEGKTKDAIGALVSYLKLSRHAHDREVIARRLYRLTHTE